MKISEYIGNLNTGEIGEYFADYDSDYVCDVITEIADNCVSIYTKELIEFAMNEDEWVNQAFWSGIALGGREYFEHHHNATFRDYAAHVGACAEYEKNNSDLYKHMEDNVRLSICTELRKRGFDELTPEQVDVLDMLSIDNNDRIDSLIDHVLEEFSLLEEDAA